MSFDLQPILENTILILRPLQPQDFDSLFKVASDPLIWDQHPSKDRCQKVGFDLFFKESIASKGAFAVMDKKTGEVIGSTRFASVKETENAIEIGWTFLSRQYWGREYNRSMKILLMDYAFRFVDNILFFVHESNFRSQRAVEKIGGERIEQLENQIIEPRPNATVVYRIHRAQGSQLSLLTE